MATIGGRGSKGAAAEGGQCLRKGPWTKAEDAILMEYVKRNGEGNWNSVQKNSGLMRCGKSCRLRWANHLRPNLKKGSFTAEEERTIIALHSKLGYKWSRMASQLPGRTDNEIKNYWNTRMKRRQRSGLPLYSAQVQDDTTIVHFQQQQQQQQKQQKKHNSSSLPFLLASPRKSIYNPSLSLFDPNDFSAASLNPPQNRVYSYSYNNPNHRFKFFGHNSNNPKEGSLFLPLSPVSSYPQSPSPTTLFNQRLWHAAARALPSTPSPSPPPPTSLNYNAIDLDHRHNNNNNVGFTSLMMGAEVEAHHAFIAGLNSQLPLAQTPPRPVTPVSSSKNTDDESGNEDGMHVMGSARNSGMLDAFLQEAKALSRKGKSNGEASSSEGKRVADGCRSSTQASADLSSSKPSRGMKPGEEPALEEINSTDDDLSSLLDNFPSSMPLPKWYPQSRNASNGLPSTMEGRSLHVQQDATLTATVPATSPNLEWALGSCHWSNMPGIC